MLKRVIIAVCLCLAVVSVCLVCATYFHMDAILFNTTQRYRYECPMHLEDVGESIMTAAHKLGPISEDLTSLTNLLAFTPDQPLRRTRPYLCPAVQTPADPNRAGSFGYRYVDWSARQFAGIKDVPGEYPLVYDNALSNHVYRGVYVLKVDGSIMWDAGAEWIREFSSRHPEYHIVVPQ
jgi:hypothetical protein